MKYLLNIVGPAADVQPIVEALAYFESREIPFNNAKETFLFPSQKHCFTALKDAHDILFDTFPDSPPNLNRKKILRFRDAVATPRAV